MATTTKIKIYVVIPHEKGNGLVFRNAAVSWKPVQPDHAVAIRQQPKELGASPLVAELQQNGADRAPGRWYAGSKGSQGRLPYGRFLYTECAVEAPSDKVAGTTTPPPSFLPSDTEPKERAHNCNA